MSHCGGISRVLFFTFLSVLLCSHILLPLSGPKKGFEALARYDYFLARKVFLKKAKKHPAAANYGLSIITGRNDNPFHNLDSAYVYIKRSKQAFGLLGEGKREKLRSYDIDNGAIEVQLDSVRLKAWERAQRRNSIADYTHFINFFGKSEYSVRASDERSELAFAQAKETNSRTAYAEFIVTYPDASERYEAKNRLDAAIYQEYAEVGTLEAYTRFIQEEPTSPYRASAEDRIFELSTSSKSPVEYVAFIRDFPTNRNVNGAWRALYDIKTRGRGAESIEAFIDEYPDYPFLEDLMVDMESSMRELFPFVEHGQWGFMDQSGSVVVAPNFDWVEEFEGQIAIVGKDEKVGCIDKTGRVVTKIIYDEVEGYHDGRATVELNGKFGVVASDGSELVAFEYDDLGLPLNDRIFAGKEDVYGYVDLRGTEVIPLQYEEALPFNGNAAVVRSNGMYGLIGRDGSVILPMEYEFVGDYDNGLARVRKEGQFGLVDRQGIEVLPATYDHIRDFSDGLSVVVKDGKIAYVDSSATFVIPFAYDANSSTGKEADFHNGYASVRKGRKFGLIDKKGVVVLPIRYESVGEFEYGLVPVQLDGGWFYVDLNGRRTGNGKYAYAEPFEHNLGKAISKSDEPVVVLHEGSELKIDNADNVVIHDPGHYSWQIAGKYDLNVMPGDNLLPPLFDSIERVSPTVLKIERDGIFAYYRTDKQEFSWMQQGFNPE